MEELDARPANGKLDGSMTRKQEAYRLDFHKTE